MKKNLERKSVYLYINTLINNNNNNNNNIMPSIKKTDIINNNDDENISNKLSEECNINFLKDVFTLDNFLECEKTKYLLEQEWEYEFNYIEENLYNFYKKEVDYCNENKEPFFSNKLCNFNKLLNIINKYIEPNYNIDIFYENTELANPLIEKFDFINENIKINKKKQIVENYNKKCKNKGKLFNWGTKKHY